MRQARHFAAIISCVVVGGLFVVAAASQQQPSFTTRTDIVELDVSVLDGNHRPIRSLSRADFTVFEDGKAQEIAVFQAVDVEDAVPSPPWADTSTRDVSTNTDIVTRLWVLVLDDALVPPEPFALRTSLQVARDFIQHLGPSDLAAVVYTVDSRKAQDFTNDKGKLIAALDQFNPGWAIGTKPPPGQKANPDWLFWGGAIRTLQNVMDTLTLLPHHRKAVLWISGGINPLEDDSRDALQAMKLMAQTARFANVPVYAVQPCGLVTELGKGKCIQAAVNIPSLAGLASLTRGRLIANTNNYAPYVDEIFEENRSYYLLGYSPRNTKADGRQRRLEVKVKRDGVVVRTRTGFQVSKQPDLPPQTSGEALDRAIALPVPLSALPLRAVATPFAVQSDTGFATVAVTVGVQPPKQSLVGQSTLDLNIGAFTTEGDRKATERQTTSLSPAQSSDDRGQREVLATVRLPSGRFRLRIAAHHVESRLTGTVMVDVTVPSFDHDELSASGISLTATSAPASGPANRFLAFLPMAPTSLRDFARDDRATAMFYVYQPVGRPLVTTAVQIQLLDSHGNTIVSQKREIDVNAFSERGVWNSAAVVFDLPLGSLQTGAHLLRFNLSAGNSSLHRDVQFLVR